MIKKPDPTSLDERVAAYTDALLEGKDMSSRDLQGLDGVVKQLYHTITPQTPTDAAFRARLAWRLEREWDAVHRRRSPRWMRQPAIRLAALAASFVLVLTAILLILERDGSLSRLLAGSAVDAESGSPEGVVILFIIMSVVAVGAAIVWWLRRRG